MCAETADNSRMAMVKPDPRLLDRIGHEYAKQHGVCPVGRVGALTLVAARDMWARIDTIDHLEAALGPITFVEAT